MTAMVWHDTEGICVLIEGTAKVGDMTGFSFIALLT